MKPDLLGVGELKSQQGFVRRLCITVDAFAIIWILKRRCSAYSVSRPKHRASSVQQLAWRTAGFLSICCVLPIQTPKWVDNMSVTELVMRVGVEKTEVTFALWLAVGHLWFEWSGFSKLQVPKPEPWSAGGASLSWDRLCGTVFYAALRTETTLSNDN